MPLITRNLFWVDGCSYIKNEIFFSYCHNVFTGYCKLSQLHLVFDKNKSVTNWKLGGWAYSCAPCTAYWKPSGQGHWKTCLIPSNRCKLIFRGLVQWSSSNRMLLCGPDIFLINATNCSIFLFICIFLFPGNYNDSVECSKSCKTEFLGLSVFLCCLKVNHKTL